MAEAFGGLGDEDDIYADSKLTEQRVEARIDLQYQGEQHTLFGELSVSNVKVAESNQFINLDPVTNLPSPIFNEFPGPVDDMLDRGAVSLVLQDEYRIDSSLTLTSGLRYDNYEDIDTAISPRIALVWRYSDNHVFKTQYARAFRPPSLIETGGRLEASIDPEINDTVEFGHIYLSTGFTLRNTVFMTRIEDLIVFQDSAPFGYLNAGSHELLGYELEFEKPFAEDWEIVASLSLQDYSDETLPAAAPWMAKLGIGYLLSPSTNLHLQLHSPAARARGRRYARRLRADHAGRHRAAYTKRLQRRWPGIALGPDQPAGRRGRLPGSGRHLPGRLSDHPGQHAVGTTAVPAAMNRGRRPMMRSSSGIGLVFALCLLSAAGTPVLAQDPLSPRLQIGINLLPAVIAANNGLAKFTENDSLPIYFVYLENNHIAELLNRSIDRIGEIKQRQLDARAISLEELLARDIAPMSTIFVAEPLVDRLGELIEYSKARRALLFSPFKGDVDRGVASGFHVTDRVRPLVNLETLKQSKIQLKAFFLRIAVKHE